MWWWPVLTGAVIAAAGTVTGYIFNSLTDRLKALEESVDDMRDRLARLEGRLYRHFDWDGTERRRDGRRRRPYDQDDDQ